MTSAARQIFKRVRTVRVNVQEVPRRLVGEPCKAPQIGIDRVLDDELAIGLEECTNLRRKLIDGAAHDKLVRLEAPCVEPCGHGHRERHDESNRYLSHNHQSSSETRVRLCYR